MSEPMARQFGDFLGKFLDYDTSIPSSSNRNYMRIRVRLEKHLQCSRADGGRAGVASW